MMNFFLRTVHLLCILFVTNLLVNAQTKFEISPNGRYLQTVNGVPFFINACTAWTLPVDYSRDEVKVYLDNRVKEGFNTIQMSAVFSEIDKTMYRNAFHDTDLAKPVASYWQQVDWCVKEATDRGLVVILNPIWKRSVNEFLRQQGEKKCRAYGKWFAEKYKDNPRVFYFIGGNRYVLRRQAWWNVTSGAIGVAYGAEGIWHKNRDGETWTKCLEYESSKDMGRLKKLFDSLEWWKLHPDITHKVLIAGYGEYLTDDYATAAVTDDFSFALLI